MKYLILVLSIVCIFGCSLETSHVNYSMGGPEGLQAEIKYSLPSGEIVTKIVELPFHTTVHYLENETYIIYVNVVADTTKELAIRVWDYRTKDYVIATSTTGTIELIKQF